MTDSVASLTSKGQRFFQNSFTTNPQIPKSQMGRRQTNPEATHCSTPTLLLLGLLSSALVYVLLSALLKPHEITPEMTSLTEEQQSAESDGRGGGCCRGIASLELWGAAVKWGSEFKFNSSEECCEACKGMCGGTDGPCLCDSWVFCGNREACGSKFGECWLKKQKDTLSPERQDTGETVSWTSGIIFGRGEGIIGLETQYGTLHLKLLPDCAPHSVAYILELLQLRHCAGCQFYRAESRGESWDSEGNHIKDASFGPPFALVQGNLEAQGATFKELPTENRPILRRGSVAWIGSGPEFFISLANHEEWKKEYTVFASVLPEDMHIAETITQLPTTADVWNNINVSVLEKPVPLKLRRITTSH